MEDQDEGQVIYADSAYTGEKQEEAIAEKKMVNLVCKKGHKNKPLAELEVIFNRENPGSGPELNTYLALWKTL